MFSLFILFVSLRKGLCMEVEVIGERSIRNRKSLDLVHKKLKVFTRQGMRD